MFVFSVTNPWAASSWDFLRLISNQWKKNIVFVVQQADLRDEAEVASVVKHLDQTILQILGSNRPIFAVSAKQAFQAKTTADGQKQALWKASNFGPLERSRLPRRFRTARSVAAKFGRSRKRRKSWSVT